MRQLIKFGVVTLCCLFSSFNYVLSAPLKVPKIAQKTSKWCWAAAAEMVLRFHGFNTNSIVAQCRQASRLAGVDCCVPLCPSGTIPASCLVEGWPDFSVAKFDAECKNSFLEWDEITSEIKAGRPVIGTWFYVKSKISHTMVIYDAQVSAGFRMVSVIDPERKCEGKFLEPIAYEDYKRVPQRHRQWYNFYKIKAGEGRVKNCPKPDKRLPAALLAEGSVAEVVEESTVNAFASADEAATGSWRRIFKAAGESDNIWGELNISELVKANIGVPVEEYFVNSGELSTYQGINPMLALSATGRRTYPVEIDGVAVASITVFRDGDIWRFSSFDPGVMVVGSREKDFEEVFQIFRLRSDLISRGEGGMSDFGKIEVPETGDSFLALIKSSKLYFVPLIVDPILGLKPGAKEMGDVVLQRLEAKSKLE